MGKVKGRERGKKKKVHVPNSCLFHCSLARRLGQLGMLQSSLLANDPCFSGPKIFEMVLHFDKTSTFGLLRVLSLNHEMKA